MSEIYWNMYVILCECIFTLCAINTHRFIDNVPIEYDLYADIEIQLFVFSFMHRGTFWTTKKNHKKPKPQAVSGSYNKIMFAYHFQPIHSFLISVFFDISNFQHKYHSFIANYNAVLDDSYLYVDRYTGNFMFRLPYEWTTDGAVSS